jgi:hypothetical protein
LNSRIITCQLFLSLLLLSLGSNLNADVIDSYTAHQGPFTVGPGEEIAEEDALLETSSVLDAPPDTTAAKVPSST